MLEQIDLTKKMEKDVYKEKIAELEPVLARLQRECKELGIPVMVVFEGFGASGKGLQINKLIHPLDPRGFKVYAMKQETQEEKMYPFLWRFWTRTPEKGRISIFDTSWYRRISVDRFEGNVSGRELAYACQEINTFEKTLSDDGTVIIKLFMHISKKEQKKRFDALLANDETKWRVSKKDIERNKHYKEYKSMLEEMLEKTETEYAPWTVVESTDKRFATVKILMTVAERLQEKIREKKTEENRTEEEPEGKETLSKEFLESSTLSRADLTLSYTREEYKEKLKALQKKLTILHSELYSKRVPVILCFEGWDAGGKGGAIKRLTEAMDPRGYVVNPTAAPTPTEKAHHYLWRFWKDMPKAGHVAIFDRTWYGRVMVERIEGFCTEEEWKRAYKEINDMEAHLAHSGAVVLKFWMHIDKEEQERRFKERMENPEKQWKITDEDWRNREKWDEYETAVNEMIIKTSTSYAPWILVEGNNKYYARIKVLEAVVTAIENRLKK